MQEVSEWKASAGSPLCDMRSVCVENGSPLPLDQQLCRPHESQILSTLSAVRVAGHGVHHYVLSTCDAQFASKSSFVEVHVYNESGVVHSHVLLRLVELISGFHWEDHYRVLNSADSGERKSTLQLWKSKQEGKFEDYLWN